MKTIKLLVALLLTVFCSIFCFASCDSKDTSLPESYQGYYRAGSAGCARIGGTYCSACYFYVNDLEIDGVAYTGVIQVEAQSFKYYSDGTFEFTGYVSSIYDSVGGTATLTGKLSSAALTKLNIDQVAGALIRTDTVCSNAIHNHD